MKNLFLITLSFFLFIACEGETTKNQDLLETSDPSDSMVGEWQLVEQNVSNGGPSTWESVENGNTFNLNDDGSFSGISFQDECDTGTFEATDDELTFNYNCLQDSKPFTYSLKKTGADIILSPKTVICIEACEYKYRKK